MPRERLHVAARGNGDTSRCRNGGEEASRSAGLFSSCALPLGVNPKRPSRPDVGTHRHRVEPGWVKSYLIVLAPSVLSWEIPCSPSTARTAKRARLTNDRARPPRPLLRVRCGVASSLPRKKPAERPAYTLKTNEERHDSPSNDQEYVEHLTKKAAKEQKRKPASRNRFPVDLLAGLVLFASGIGISLFVILGEGGMMNTLVNGFLCPMIFIITGGRMHPRVGGNNPAIANR